MIAKCKAIAHGAAMIAYAMRESKMENMVASNMIMGTTPEEVFAEMEAVNQYANRCKNPYLRFEIGIAPKDEKRLTPQDISLIAEMFAAKMGLENHQWIACTHKDTDNLHIHLVANRVSIGGEVYKTDFVSNRSAKAAEEISRELGLTIAKEVKAEKEYRKRGEKPDRTAKRYVLRKIAYEALRQSHSPKELFANLNKQGVVVEQIGRASCRERVSSPV